MTKKVGFIHTVPSLVGTFNDLAKEYLPADVEVFHIADEMLLKVVVAQGGLSPFIFRRVTYHVIAAEEGGASVVQVTCSSISPCVEAARPFVPIPVLKIDDPMVAKALELGSRIGIAATVPTTLKPTTDLVYSMAAQTNKTVQVSSVLCEGAFHALMSGDSATHDRIIRQYLQQLLANTDVVLLAQASMARVAATIPVEEQKVPVLSSPRLAIERLAGVLAGLK
jgi:Asp/Glu/hydantoin racemase